MHVIGTAGHVDHGKSTLVSALTGINPDRLKEEQEREMTIDLGFAWLTLPEGEVVGVVDVPGHQDFIENMLAGVGGIDAVLLVVAADEGIMPQTREHLEILDLLQVSSGVIVITKIELVDDPEWLGMVETEIHQAVQGTALADAPVVRVSARTRAGLDELLETLSRQLASQVPRPNLGRPRLPVDRAFSIRGFGTVVTGTQQDGEFNLGDEVVALPSGAPCRVRGLQSYKQKVKKSLPDSRTAINLSGIDLDQLERGDVIALPGTYWPTRRLDVYVRLARGSGVSLKHGSEVKLYIGTSNQVARIRLLDTEEILPGQSAWIQLELAQPIIAAKDDRFILRRPSPAETIGGGIVVDPNPKQRHKRFSAEVIGGLELLRAVAPKEVIFRTITGLGSGSIDDVVRASNLKREDVLTVLRELITENRVVLLNTRTDGQALNIDSGGLLMARTTWDTATTRCLRELQSFHEGYPLRKGMPKEELKSRLKLSSRLFAITMQEWRARGLLVEQDDIIKLSGFELRYSLLQREALSALMDKFARSPFAPPTSKECADEVGQELFDSLVETGVLIAVSPEVVFKGEDYAGMVAAVRSRLAGQTSVTLAQIRDQFNTSRKYAQALMEHLDKIGVTIRAGDYRRLNH